MATSNDPPKPKASRVTLWINLALVLGAVATFFAWRHARDPHQLWAKRVEENHARYIRVGCAVDKTTTSYPAYQNFVQFMKSYCTLSHLNKYSFTSFIIVINFFSTLVPITC